MAKRRKEETITPAPLLCPIGCDDDYVLQEIKSILASRSDPDPMKTVLLQESERYSEHDFLLFLLPMLVWGFR